MKYMMNKYLRFGIVIILILCIGITSFFTYRVVYNDETIEVKNPLYSYNSKGKVNYSVSLKPNSIYNGTSQGENEVYIMEYVDALNTSFNYEFIGEGAADISGEYTITAIIEGYVGNEESRKMLWDKEFPLINRKAFKSDNGQIVLKENLKLGLQLYNDFVKEINKETKIDSQNIMTIVMHIDLNVVTPKGEIQENIKPSLMFPINTNMFEVSGNREFDIPGAIEEIVLVKKPMEINQLILHSVILGILVIGLIVLLKLTQGQTFVNPMEKQLRFIFRKYGDRMVALDSNIMDSNSRVVKSIDDLVRVADELGKPILYKHSEDFKDINKFYVINDEERYVYKIEEIIIEENIHEDEGSQQEV